MDWQTITKAFLFFRLLFSGRKWRVLIQTSSGEGIGGLSIFVDGDEIGCTDSFGRSTWLRSSAGSQIDLEIFKGTTAIHRSIHVVPNTNKSLIRIIL